MEWVQRCGRTAEKTTSKKANTLFRQWKEILVHCNIIVLNAFLCGGTEIKDQNTAVTINGNVVTVEYNSECNNCKTRGNLLKGDLPVRAYITEYKPDTQR